MYLGIDIGSSSSKAVILDHKKSIVAYAVVNLGTGTDGLNMALQEAFDRSGMTMKNIKYTVATGYGRVNCELADTHITEISCHGRGVAHLMKGVKTVIDIGGQDSKVIRLDDTGRTINFMMNDKCAAGTGRFLEVMSRVLGCRIDELSSLAEKGAVDIPISSVCTVFAESEVISQLSKGLPREDVARGAHVSVAKRVAGMCNRIGVEPGVVMTGGVALNAYMVKTMARELNMPIEATPYPQLVGAIGAAVFAYERYHSKGEQSE